MREPSDEIIIEIAVIGTIQRVTAIDPASLVEVVFQAPVGAERDAIFRLARQKLAYRLGQRAQAPVRPPDRGGTLV